MAKILIVDDSPTEMHILRTALLKSGHSVVTATSGEEALEVARVERPDLILMDVIMPGMNGRELARQMMAKRQGLSVLYVSGYTENMTLRHGVLDADVNFLQKPFPLERLLRRVRETLDNRR